MSGKTGVVANSFLSTIQECRDLPLVFDTVFPEVARVVFHQFHKHCVKV